MRGWMMALLATLLAAVAAPVYAQSPCDGAAPTSFFTLPPGTPGASFVFPFTAVDHDNGVASYSLQLRRAPAATGQPPGPVLSTQSVTKAATSALGPVTGQAGVNCYAIPVVPVAQLPRGVPIVASLRALGVVTELSSAEGPSTAPFGAALPAPAIRPRPE